MSKKRIEILNVGDHIDSRGRLVRFDRADLEQIAQSYNPDRFKAALFVTPTKGDQRNAHDTGGIPDAELFQTEYAFGYPDRLEVRDNSLWAEFEKISPKFLQAYDEGAILAVSCSVYEPDSPHNPTKGRRSLRHIAALGKSPPAIKGLAMNLCEAEAEYAIADFSSWQPEEEGTIAVRIDLDFNEQEDTQEDTMGRTKAPTPTAPDTPTPTSPPAPVQFQAPITPIGGTTGVDVRPSTLFQKVREYLIADKGLEAAEQVIPEALVTTLRTAEDQEEDEDAQAATTIDALKSQNADLSVQLAALVSQVQMLTDQVAQLSSDEINEDGDAVSQDAMTGMGNGGYIMYSENDATMTSTAELAKKLKVAMRDRKMDAAAVSNATQISSADLDSILKGEAAPTAKQMAALVKTLNLDEQEMQAHVKKGGKPNPAKGGNVEPPNGETPELSEAVERTKPVEMSEEAKQRIAELEEQVRQKDLEAKAAKEQAEIVQRNARQAELQSFCEGLVQDGKLTVAELGDRVVSFGETETESDMVSFMASLTPEQEAYMRDFLSDRAPVIDYSERATPTNDAHNSVAVSFSAAPGYEVDPERNQEYAEIVNFCETHKLDPKNPEQLRQGALQYYAQQSGNL